MSDFTDALRLHFDKLSVAKYNFEKLKNLGSKIARISALHSGRNAKNATSDDAGGLDVVIFLADGAAVILTSNLWQEVGLCNGATGVVEDLLFHPDRPPPCQPIAALVHFTNYTGPAFLTTNPKTVPIPPHLFEWESDGKAEKAAGSSFVAISRVRSLQNLVLQPVSFQRLEAIGKSKQLQERL